MFANISIDDFFEEKIMKYFLSVKCLIKQSRVIQFYDL